MRAWAAPLKRARCHHAHTPWRKISYIRPVCPERVVAIGDVHGDMLGLEALLDIASIVDPITREWTGGSTVLVQIGDVVDRGPDEVEIIRYLDKLTDQARASGGDVLRLMGNHELMNHVGDFRYVDGPWGDGSEPFERDLGPILDDDNPGWRDHPAIAPFPHRQRARAAAFFLGSVSQYCCTRDCSSTIVKGHLSHPPFSLRTYSCDLFTTFRRFPCINPCLKPFRATTHVCALLGDTLFVHGGLLPAHLKLPTGSTGSTALKLLDSLNEDSSRWVHGVAAAPPPVWLGHEHGPLWLRLLSAPEGLPLGGKQQHAEVAFSDAAAQRSRWLNEILDALGCVRMVVGHTPQDKINKAVSILPRDDGRPACVWRIDTAVSQGMGGGVPEVLEIRGHEVSVLTTSGAVLEADRDVTRTAPLRSGSQS